MSGFNFFAANGAAFNSREPEVLLAGAAGTGKSLAWLAKTLALCDLHPGARCLIVRKTRESLTESVLVTWERDILGPHHPVLLKNPTLRRVRQSYRFGNRSEVVVGGMDKPDKVLSSEWDFIYAPEATDLELTDWETLGGRLRAGVVPFQQLAGDCNPTTPHHWLYKRQAAGLLKLYTSTHKDNPRFYDRVSGEWTESGRQYLARLERMTGARRARFLEGKWVAAEGVVYEYDPERHLLPAGWSAPKEWPRVWGIDWGKTSPTVLGIWAVDPDGRMYRTREVYKTRLRPDVLGKKAKEWVSSGREPRPKAVVCDHDTANEGYQEQFEGASGLPLELADKIDRKKGIEATQSRFDVGDDGRPRIFFAQNARDHPADQFLVENGRPADGLEEIVGYVYDPDFLADEPIAENDHFCLVAGTLVATARGLLPIEGVRVGDMALTRHGFYPVVSCGMTNPAASVVTLEFDNGTTITGTPNHPVAVSSTEFVRFDEMRYGDTAICLKEDSLWKSFLSLPKTPASSASVSTGSFTAATRSARTHQTATISDAATEMRNVGSGGCTATSGSITTARFRIEGRSTTRTRTRSTTTSATWNASLPKSITPDTNTTPGSVLPLFGRERGISGFRVPQSGTDPRRGGRGTVSKPSRFGETPSWWTRFASTAATAIVLSPWGTHRSSARSSVGPPPDASAAMTTSRDPVRLVPNRSSSTDTTRSDSVHQTAAVRLVSRVEHGQPAAVFNLAVEGPREFFANGILTHNCDQMRYVVRWVDSNLCGGSSYGVPKAALPTPAVLGRRPTKLGRQW